jgi:ParB-like chromosome segregation protein Spo0J
MSVLQVERKAHPVAEIFPPMSDVEHSDLVTDIREHGLREPIWLHPDGRIIDGRNRYRACALAAVDPAFRTYEGDEFELVSFVISLNLKRRHLNETQRAMVAAKIANLTPGRRHATASIEAVSGVEDLFAGGQGEPSRTAPAGVTQADAAKLLNVGRASVQRAREVIDHGAPELVGQVERGEIAVSTAAAISAAPIDEQREVASLADKREQRERANAIRERNRKPTAPGTQPLSSIFVPSDRLRRGQELNKAIQAAQKAYGTLVDFSDEELALFAGKDTSARELLSLLRDQYAAWFDKALIERPSIRSIAGGSS